MSLQAGTGNAGQAGQGGASGDAGSAGAGGTAGGNAGGSGAGAAAPWMEGLTDDHKGYVQTKGFKDVSAILDSYRHSESLIGKLTGAGKDRIIALPEKEDAPEWDGIYEKLGRPKEAKEYQIEVPKELGDEKFAEWAQETFHKLGLSRKQAESLAKGWNERIAGLVQAQSDEAKGKLEADQGALKKKWGAALEQNTAIAKRGAQAFGVDETTLDQLESVMGYAKTMEFFHGIGAKLGEDAFVGGGNGGAGGFGGLMTPEAAMSRINALRQDGDFVRRYTNGEVAARQEMERLHKMAYPES